MKPPKIGDHPQRDARTRLIMELRECFDRVVRENARLRHEIERLQLISERDALKAAAREAKLVERLRSVTETLEEE